jgi:ATP-dependent DNA ligase
MLTVAVTKLPEAAACSYELKLDGCRAIGVKAVLGSRRMRAYPVGEVPK